jgi:hypothetical protein
VLRYLGVYNYGSVWAIPTYRVGNYYYIHVHVFSTSSSDLPYEDRAYDRQIVTFRCAITGVDTVIVLNWRSEHYIGTGGDVLQLVSADPLGRTASNSRNPTTVAILISTSRSSGVTTTVSELRLTASSQFPTSSVSCANNGDGRVNTIVFQTLFGKEDCVTLSFVGVS